RWRPGLLRQLPGLERPTGSRLGQGARTALTHWSTAEPMVVDGFVGHHRSARERERGRRRPRRTSRPVRDRPSADTPPAHRQPTRTRPPTPAAQPVGRRPPAASRPRYRRGMTDTLAAAAALLPESGRRILALAGPPAAGKSTLAEALVEGLNHRFGPGTAA